MCRLVQLKRQHQILETVDTQSIEWGLDLRHIGSENDGEPCLNLVYA